MGELKYMAGDTECVGYVAYPDGDGPHPVVMIAPAFGGVGPFSREKADWLASLGYIGFEIDYYGDGAQAADETEATKMMRVLQNDRATLRVRLLAALEIARELAQGDKARVAAMGFCFGGKAVLDLARTGEVLAGVAPFHGIFDAPPEGSKTMNTSVLVLHGWDDPLATPSDVVTLTEELTTHCKDWQLLAFGHTSHAFTNPQAQAPESGMAFSASADTRAFAALEHFLEEVFAREP